VKINSDFRSPNFDSDEIEVQFLVLHYTATSTAEALKIFSDPLSKVSAHLLISRAGEVFEIVPCLEQHAKRAWHAGESRWKDEQGDWIKFNDFSIGIELENLNGNVIPYSEEQYLALKELMVLLKARYPKLSDPFRVIGHEQIAGFRGKCDPGRRFDWERVFADSYPGMKAPQRRPVLPAVLVPKVKLLCRLFPRRAAALNAFLERFLSIINRA